MHKPVFLILLYGVFGFLSLSGQCTENSKAVVVIKDSSRVQKMERRAAISKTAGMYKSFIVPSSLVVCGILANHADAFQDINEIIKKKVFTERQPTKTKIDNYLQYTPAVLVYGLNIAGVHGKNNFHDRTAIYSFSSLIMGTAVYATKIITAETRPDGSDKLSFPSGHTATAFAAAEFLRQEYKNVSPWYGVAGYLAAATTGYLRISNNRHWLGDVVAGAGIGMISTKLAYLIYPAIKRKILKKREFNAIILPTCQNKLWGSGQAHHE